jgi:hypothetical protein
LKIVFWYLLIPKGLYSQQEEVVHKITVAAWRTPEAAPMQVSGAMGKEKVQYTLKHPKPNSCLLKKERESDPDYNSIINYSTN